MSAEPVVPGEGRPDLQDAITKVRVAFARGSLTPAEFGDANDAFEQILANVAEVARPALPAPPGNIQRVLAAASDLLEEWNVSSGELSPRAIERLSTALKGVVGSALPAPEPPPGPWRVAQNAGATPQPRYVELWEADPYGAVWKSNGFPTAEEAQAVCDALNAVRSRERK